MRVAGLDPSAYSPVSPETAQCPTQASARARPIDAMSTPEGRAALHLVSARHEGAGLADCSTCVHRDSLRVDGRCVPGDVCLIAHSGRQIERFLRRNPEYAESCLRDGFWERRAIAVRYAPLAAVAPLARDADEVVRRAVALRLPAEELMALRRDVDREVRITVASRLPPERLEVLMSDPDYLVRQRVAERIPHGRLTRMLADPEREVCKAVARRLPAFALRRMATDSDAEVRRIVAARLPVEDLACLLVDPDWLVRLEAARRAPPAALAALLDDPEPDVRALARARRDNEETM